MKDSYSFDLDDAGLAASYAAHRAAYQRIFDRLGLDYRIVSAVSGAMGGSASEEFLAPAESGEDTFVQCENCDYAANTEAVEIAVPPAQDPAAPAGRRGHRQSRTPRRSTRWSTCSTACDLGRRFTAADTLKNVVLKTRTPGSRTGSCSSSACRVTARST